MAYIEKSDIENYLGVSIDDSLDTFIESLIDGVEDYVESVTGRKFEAPDPDTATTRYYDGNGLTKLSIDDIREITSVTVDDVALAVNVDYFPFPLNALADGEPYERLDLNQNVGGNQNPRANSTYVFDCGQRNVVVVGKFGYSATPPAAIKMACIKIASGMIRENITTDLKEVTAETLGEYNVTYGKISEVANAVKSNELLDQFTRKNAPNRESLSGQIQVS